MSNIDARYIVRIIKACKVSGVSELKLGELEIKFGTGDAAQTKVANTGDAAPAPTDEELRVAQDDADTRTILDRADEELAHMQVDNPALFEELLVNRELEHSGHRERDDD